MTLDEVLVDVAQGLIHGVDNTAALDEVMQQVTMNFAEVTLPTFDVVTRFIRIYHDEALTAAYQDEFEAIVDSFEVLAGDCE